MTQLLDRLAEALRDRYTIECELGAGGMATVYLAHDVRHNRKVAVKVLRPELAAILGAERFLKEIEVTANLQHPNILPLFDSGAADGFVYYVMPFVEGESLRDKLTREQQLPIDETVAITIAIANALEYAHSRDVIHRDIKPANILLQHGQAVVADFGIALAVKTAGGTRLTESGLSVGTPQYMSPEQATGDRQLHARSDVYSLAAVVYEMLTGEPPHTGPTVDAVVAKLLTTTPVRPKTLREGVPASLDAAVMRALSKTPADRYASAKRFAEEVARAGAGGPEVGAAARVPASRWTRLALFAAVALTLAAGAGLIAPRVFDSSVGLEPNRVVVAPFENRTADPTLDILGELAADQVRKQMEAIEHLEFVPTWTTMIAWRVAAANGAGAEQHPAKLLARETGAGIVVRGWYYRQHDSLYFHAETTEQPSDRRIASVGPIGADTGRVSTNRAIDSLGTLVAAQVAFDRDAFFNPEFMGAFADPPTLDAYQAYSRGMELFSSFRFAGAVPQFEQAASLDSTFREPLIWASVAQSNLGDFAASDTLLRVLDRQRDRLSPMLRQFLDERRAEERGDYNTALNLLRAQMKLVPDPTAFELGWVATLLNRPREAIAALRTLDPDRGWLTSGIWYWSRLADAYHLAGDYRNELRTALQGLERHHANAALLLMELRARAALGQAEPVRHQLSEARLLQASFWQIAISTGLELAAHDRRDPSPRDVFEEALGWLADRNPEQRLTPDHQLSVAQTLYLLGRWDDAKRIFDTLGREDPDNLTLLGWSGVTAARLRDRVAADSVRRLLATLDYPYGYGRSSYWQARIAAQLGDREGAVAALREALRLGFRALESHGPVIRNTAYPIVIHLEPDFEVLRGFPSFGELMRPKG